MLTLISRCRQGLTWALSMTCAALMALLVFCVSWQVFSRYVLAQPSTLTDELSRFLLIWLVLLGAAICTSTQRHLAIDLLHSALKGNARRAIEMYAHVVVGAFAIGVMVIGGLRIVDTSARMSEISPAMQLPMDYVYAVLPLSGTLIALFCAINVLEAALSPSSLSSRSTDERENLK